MTAYKQKMNEKSWTCALCTQVKATCFCCCEDQETFLCADCFGEHYKKLQFQMHVPIPISAFGQHKNQGYLNRLQVRAAKIPKAKMELHKSVDVIDLCIAELLQQIEDVVNKLNLYGSKVIAELQDMKYQLQKAINEGIAEAEKTLFEHAPVLTSKWARLVRNFNGDLNTLKCFSYEINTKKVCEALQSICMFSKPDQNDPLVLLYGVRGKTLTMYNLISNHKKVFTLSLDLQNNMKLCELGSNQLLVVGGNSTLAYQISVRSGEIVKTTEMSIPRKSPGVICVNNVAYVIGGENSEAEKYLVPSSTWQKMPKVTTIKNSPAVCHFKNIIYLLECGWLKGFNTTDETIQNLCAYHGNPEIPLMWTENEEIVIVAEASISRWKPEAKVLDYKSCEMHGNLSPSQCLPVRHKGKVYYVSRSSSLLVCLEITGK